MSDDLIKRSDAIRVMACEMYASAQAQGYEVDSIEVFIHEAKAWMNDAPSADRPQGEWILLEPRYTIEQKVYWNKEQALADTKGNGAIERRKCSCCGFTKNFMGHMKDKQFKLWNFCPNCGASMKGADDE